MVIILWKKDSEKTSLYPRLKPRASGVGNCDEDDNKINIQVVCHTGAVLSGLHTDQPGQHAIFQQKPFH